MLGRGRARHRRANVPAPEGVDYRGWSGCPTLDTLTVRVLTAVFRGKKEKPPTCIASWSARVPGHIPWQELGQMFQGGLLTPTFLSKKLHRMRLDPSFCEVQPARALYRGGVNNGGVLMRC